MPKKKKKSIRKAKKRPARPAKRARSKASSRKKKPVRNQGQTARVLAVEVTELEIIGDIQQDPVEETEATLDPLDEHFPPDYGGSE
jgi:hypothetical protein